MDILIDFVEYAPGPGRGSEHIAYVGGTDTQGVWKAPVSLALTWIRERHRLFTRVLGTPNASVVTEQRGQWTFIRTGPDGTARNNLAVLPDFGARPFRMLR